MLKVSQVYAKTATIDALRDRDFQRLDATGHVYLDYTGAGLHGETQVRRHVDLLTTTVLGNPHSESPASSLATEALEACRTQVLDFFRASSEDYVAIFTANATHALKLVGEAYPFEPGGVFLLTFDNHNSVNGIREFDRARGARTIYLPVLPPELRVGEEDLERSLAQAAPGKANLFAFPAQSNFSGVRHSLDWIGRAKEAGWDVLLDAAAFVPTSRLDLSRHQPDFVTVSFYKMFGYPTGVGALIARREALGRLQRPWFAGGTITMASVQADAHFLASGAAAFEEGTPNYGAIPAVSYGLDMLDSVGMETVGARVKFLTRYLLDHLKGLVHSNGNPLVRVYGPWGVEERGGTVTLNFYDHDGAVIDHQDIEQAAAGRRISLRTGCFCNPGAGELAMGLSKEEMTHCLLDSQDGMTYNEFRRCINDKDTGAVRVSLGLVSNLADVDAFLDFARSFVR